MGIPKMIIPLMLGMSSPSRSCDRCRAVPTRDHGRAQFAGARLAVESCPSCRAQKTTNPPTVGSSGSVRGKAEAGERLHFVSGGLVLVALVGELLDPPDRNNTRSREAPRTPRRPHLGQQARRACGRRTPWCRPDRTIPPLGVKFSGPYPLSGPQGKCRKSLLRTNPFLDPRSSHFSGLPDKKTCFLQNPVFGAHFMPIFCPHPVWRWTDQVPKCVPPSLAGQNPSAFGQERPESSDDLSPVSTGHKKSPSPVLPPFFRNFSENRKQFRTIKFQLVQFSPT